MKVFWNIKLCWNKAKQIDKLYLNEINIPTTIIVEKSQYSKFKKSDIFNADRYILRPSHTDEDNIIKSNAWKYDSEIYSNVNDLYNSMQDYKSPASYIIQEFIQCEKYGVFFTHNPSNILQKWYYEFSQNHWWITSWNDNSNYKLSYFLEKELDLLSNKILNIFLIPQDIEVWIKNNEFIFFQTRPITTWNSTIYDFKELTKFHWKYNLLDLDELWDIHDYFSYNIIKFIVPCIFIQNKIYIKKWLHNIYHIIKFLFIRQNIQKKYIFYSQYRKYLINKIKFHIFYFFSFKKLDLNTLVSYYSKNICSFQLKKKSIFDMNESYTTNKKTQDYVRVEKIKMNAFKELEYMKSKYINKHNIKDLSASDTQLIFKKWIIVNIWENKINNKYERIYKDKINGILVKIEDINKTINENNVLFIDNLNIEIFPILDKIQWIIVKDWNLLSHNSIIIRENNIPCIIRYNQFDKLQAWKKITIK
jgi:phosphohistidine swiveling domain-containing protein